MKSYLLHSFSKYVPNCSLLQDGALPFKSLLLFCKHFSLENSSLVIFHFDFLLSLLLMISFDRMLLNLTKRINYQQCSLYSYPHLFVSLFPVVLKKNTPALNVCVSLSVLSCFCASSFNMKKEEGRRIDIHVENKTISVAS